ncbi:MAG: tRNA modification GTPase [Planctomycetaceae bacterium]|nr:tRNA modification GTPase [Planctomycetaceae bacterium]
MLDPEDTIAAVASPSGPGLRGLVRLSGPKSWSIALADFLPGRAAPLPCQAEIRAGSLKLAGLRPLVPALISLWPGPRTYTGGDIAEIHTTAAPPILNLVLSACLARGARHAQPGEFTLRAFLSGRLDLTRAEAVLGVIDARNAAQLDAALEQLAGGLARPIQALRERLLDLLAHLEAILDFVDEADVDPLSRAALAEELEAAAGELSALADRLNRRDRPSDRPRVVLAGPPSVGKSRLFNALIGQDHAIVSPQAGTTRDYLTAACDCDGLAIELVDTAGIQPPRDPVDAQAQAHRAEQAELADLVLLCQSKDTSLTDVLLGLPPGSVPMLHVATKCDLDPPEAKKAEGLITTSAETGLGLGELRTAIARELRAHSTEGDLPASTGARCRDSLLGAGQALKAAAHCVFSSGGEELVALELRLALDELGKVSGAVVTDDILDRIFQRFCIGK